MNNLKLHLLTATMLAACLTYQTESNKSRKQPFPEIGFWVTETNPSSRLTLVRYYANSNYLISEKFEDEPLDISKLTVRKYLNAKLLKELEKDTIHKSLPKLYEIR